MLVEEVRTHLTQKLIPFWKGMRDDEYGGYYGYMGYDRVIDKKAVKGCILNSRILWFFSNAALLLQDDSVKAEADHAYAFLRDHFVDRENGGVYWSVTYDGKVEEGMKHTYCQAFAIYGLSSYYRLTRNEEALQLAKELFAVIEDKCTDSLGYEEAFSQDFRPVDNEKLSENGVMAEKTMNTLLHVFEAYTELYDVSHDEAVGEQLRYMLRLFADRVYNPSKRRLEVFFDKEWNTLIDLHSFGHDIESAWLIDRGCDVLGDEALSEEMRKITRTLTECVYEEAYRSHSLANECESDKVDTTRVWWVQAEAIVGFTNAWQQDPSGLKYMQAAEDIWGFVKEHFVDKREGSEWFRDLKENGEITEEEAIVDPWKCPYHNGRMCMEIIRRLSA